MAWCTMILYGLALLTKVQGKKIPVRKYQLGDPSVVSVPPLRVRPSDILSLS